MAIVTSAGQIVFGFLLSVEWYRQKRWPLMFVPGISPSVYYGSRLGNSVFWKDRLILLKSGELINDREFKWYYTWFDPETNQETSTDFTVTGVFSPLVPVTHGNRLFFNTGLTWVELVDGKPQPVAGVTSTSQVPAGHRFLLDGERALISLKGTDLIISKVVGTQWENDSVVVLPSREHTWTIDGTSVNFQNVHRVQLIDTGDRLHVFLDLGGPILYRTGLDRRPITGADRTAVLPAAPPLTDEPVSALMPENSEIALAGWSVISRTLDPDYDPGQPCGMLIDGQPAILLVHSINPGLCRGSVHRFDGTQWTEFANVEFPLASGLFQVHSTEDAQRSYLFMSTSLGVTYGYRIDAAGIHPVSLKALFEPQPPLLMTLWGYGMISALTTFLGILFGFTTWLAMRKWTIATYEFRTQTVALASVGRRGLARLIDLLLLGGTTTMLMAVIMRGLDWWALSEALNLRIPHPTITVLHRAMIAATVWLAGSVVFLVLSQAWWGVTPGKWCCGLRTLRATLKPCGIARSLVREIIICVDTCNTLCWTPGIVSIALSDHRQRLGDLVADTIVVEARSLTVEGKRSQ